MRTRCGTPAKTHGLGNLTVLPFQNFENYSAVLATGDVMLAMIEPDAAILFRAVESPVLSLRRQGHCTFRQCRQSRGTNFETFRRWRRCCTGRRSWLRRSDPGIFWKIRNARQAAGAGARAYADENFDIGAIAARFETILAPCAKPPVPA
ncbi:MAG: hypothetical protein WDN29_03530 [Methylovirgula sp.]